MPPQGLPRPDPAAYSGFLSYLETALDKGTPDPGRTEALHRLNRVEYRNAVRDLLALDIDVGVPAAGRRCELRVRQHRRRPEDVADADGAVPRGRAEDQPRWPSAPSPRPVTETFRAAASSRQDDRLDGLPFGTRGGARLRYTFPVDGEYAVRVQLRGTRRPASTTFRLRRAAAARDQRRRRARARVRRSSPTSRRDGPGRNPADRLDAGWQVRSPVKAGPRTSPSTFLRQNAGAGRRRWNRRQPFLRRPAQRLPHDTQGAVDRSRRIEISGPFNAAARGRYAEPAAHLRLPPGERRRKSRPARRRSCRRWRGARTGGR